RPSPSSCLPSLCLHPGCPRGAPRGSLRSKRCVMNNSRFACHRTAAVLVAALWVFSRSDATSGQDAPLTFEEYLRKSVVDKSTLDVFLDPQQLSWAKFDAITGYRLGNYMPRDGIDRSWTISTVQSNGMRTA